MPTVPQYRREVAPQLTPTPFRDDRVNGDMFGVNVSQAQANLGRAATDFADTLINIKNRMDDTKILGLANYSSEWEQENLFDKDKGYFHKQGKDAYGKSEALLKDYDEYINGYISKSGLSPAAQRRAKETAARLRYRVMEGVTSHDYRQGVVWSNTEAETAKMNYLNTAVNMRNNPDEINKAIMSGYQAIEMQGEIQNKDDAMINLEKQQYRSQVHEAVFSALLGEGSLKASQYLEAHKEEINPQKLPHFIQAAKSNELNYTARTAAMNLLSLSMEDAYNQINKISDPQTREATMREYNTLRGQQEAIQRDKNNQFMDNLSSQLADALVNGTDANDLKKNILQSDLPFDVKQKQINYINDCLELNQEVNLWNETEYLDNLMQTDYEAFQKIDLSKFALSKSEREKYRKAQQEVKQYSTEDDLKKMVGEFDTFFWAGKNSLDGKVYKDELIGLLARIERLQGKAFDIKNIDEGSLKALIEGFDYKADTMPEELSTFGIKDFKNLDETKEIYMRAKAVRDIKEDVARSYVNFKSRNGREPEPQEMYGLVQQSYMNVARENHAKNQQKVDRQQQIYKDVNSTEIKKTGYTKALTYFENKLIPDMEKETGIKMSITSTYRPTGKYGHEKGIKVDIFPTNPTKENIEKSAEYLISHPLVERVFTSNPHVLKRYGANKKVKSAVKYDSSPEAKKAKINHITHFDITLSSQFGGTEQLKPMTISTLKPKETHIAAK